MSKEHGPYDREHFIRTEEPLITTINLVPVPSRTVTDMTLHERLPPEIFGSILHLCVGFEKPVRDLVTLQLVCWDWNNIIADASFLWGTINAAEGSRSVHKALQMAKNSLLDLTFIERRSKIDQTEFFKQTGERIDQWRSLVVESEKWEAALIDLRTRKPPKLDTLRVGSYYQSPGETEFVLFGGHRQPV